MILQVIEIMIFYVYFVSGEDPVEGGCRMVYPPSLILQGMEIPPFYTPLFEILIPMIFGDVYSVAPL